VLVLDFEALVEVETLTGKPAPQVMSEFSQGFVGAVRALLFGALRRRHPDITAVEVGEMIVSDTDAVTLAMVTAVGSSMPKPAEGKESGKARSGTTKSSGRNGAKPVSTPKPSGKQPRARSR
jgi:hypothetical protein